MAARLDFSFNRVIMTDGAYATAFAAEPLASDGFIVLQIAPRRDREATPYEASDQLAGFQSAIARLVGDGLVDPKRVGIIGFSRTCYHVETALVHAPDLFAAASISDGVDESYVQYLLFNGQGSSEAENIYGGPPFDAGIITWLKEAPGFNLGKVRTPLRIEAIGPSSVLGEWETFQGLRSRHKPVDLTYIPDGSTSCKNP